MKVCTAEQMRKTDRLASDLGGIPSIVLMENAAIACVKEAEKLGKKKIGIFCGKGNNGGDGFAIARHLFNKGYDVRVFLVCGSEFSGDAQVNYEIIEKMNIRIIEITADENLEYYISSLDLIVDAIFGTGIRGEIGGLAYDVICAINSYAETVLSADIPSGVNADTGEICGIAVRADVTVTFAAYKRGLLLYPGAECAGKVVPADISIPGYVTEECGSELEVFDKAFAARAMPQRRDNSHKGDYGKVFIVGGSRGMTGACVLAAEAALKTGAGLVTVGVPASLNEIAEIKLTEQMSLPLAEEDGALTEEAAEEILKQAEKSDVLLIGPGLGRSERTQKLVCEVLLKSKIPTVVDADALFAAANNPEVLSSCGCNLIFTPHEAEFERLAKEPINEKNRLDVAKQYAAENGITLILKGHYTVTTSPGGRQYVNTSGNSGMATGGSGDVLAGIVAALVPVMNDETEAAATGVYLHGLSGDFAAEEKGRHSMTAGDICDMISRAIPDITAGNIEKSMV